MELPSIQHSRQLKLRCSPITLLACFKTKSCYSHHLTGFSKCVPPLIMLTTNGKEGPSKRKSRCKKITQPQTNSPGLAYKAQGPKPIKKTQLWLELNGKIWRCMTRLACRVRQCLPNCLISPLSDLRVSDLDHVSLKKHWPSYKRLNMQNFWPHMTK